MTGVALLISENDMQGPTFGCIREIYAVEENLYLF